MPLWVSISAGWPIWMSCAWVSAICRAALSLSSWMTSATEVPAVTCWPTCSGSGQRREHTRDAGPHLKGIRLLLIEIEQRLGLVDLGLRGGKLDLDRLLVHIELLLAELVLGGQLVGGALRLVIGKAGDHAQIVKLLVGLRLQLVLGIVGVDLRPRRSSCPSGCFAAWPEGSCSRLPRP